MILFAADKHYNEHSGRHIYENLPETAGIEFYEDDWTCFEAPFFDTCELLILNMISGTCNISPPSPACEANIRAYIESGKPMLLLHGGSAAFWQWDWWRALVGFRWVRGDDPDGFDASNHPVRPYKVKACKTRHPLAGKLKDMFLPQDEIYCALEQTLPCWTLMTTSIDEGTFPMCYECETPYGNRVIGFLPGHSPEVCGDPQVIHNISILIQDLLSS